MEPGKYMLKSGMATVNKDMTIIFHSLELCPVEKKQATYKNLKQAWNPDNKLNLSISSFREILNRNGYLTKEDNKLYTTGRETKSLYMLLSKYGCLPDNLSMVEVYQLFAGSFNMKIKGHSSLQRIREPEVNMWERFFCACVPKADATEDTEIFKSLTDI